MPLDALFTKALAGELHGELSGMKVDKIQQPERDQLVLTLRGSGASSRLLISAGRSDPRLHLTEKTFENPQNPPMFCMLLRKHLQGGRIAGITQPPMERAVEITFESTDALGDRGGRRLIVELMGRYSNIILAGEDGRIVDCLRRVDVSMSEKRQLLPGLFYRLPPPQEKHNPLETGRDRWMALLEQAPGDAAADKWLLDTFNGLSPLICRELVSRAYGDTGSRLLDIRRADGGRALGDAFFAMTEDVLAERAAPYMLLDGDNTPYDFSFMPITQYGTALRLRQEESFSRLLDGFYTRRFAAERMRQRSQALTKTIRSARDRVERRLGNQRLELLKTRDRERSRQLGDIITAQLHEIKKGMTVLRTADFYSDDGREIDIPLDPLKTPQQNAARFYRDYTKARTAEGALKKQIALGEAEFLYLSSVLDALARAEGERDLDEIRRELEETGYAARRAGKGAKAPRPVPLRFVSSAGLDIRVGRNNVQNDALTFGEARRWDVWLHARNIPGAHVVVSAAQGHAPDEKTLGEAASLAVWFSQARGGGKTPVDCTLVKNVKKIPGGRPGMVTYTSFKTVTAEADEKLLQRLAAR